MSPRKLTEDDKQEILQLYRNSEATTSTLASQYEVSSSTISRFLKNKLSNTEYEDLIQQKRLARTPRGEKNSAKKEQAEHKTTTKTKKTRKKSLSKKKSQPPQEAAIASSESEATPVVEPTTSEPKAKTSTKRRRRRRGSAPEESEVTAVAVAETAIASEELEEQTAEQTEELKPIPEVKADSKSNHLILKSDRVDLDDDEDDEDDEVNIITLKEMLGEDLEDINDEDDDEDEDVWDEDNEEIVTYRKDADLSDIEILPLSQATFPRTCYLVIDRSAELIVKPLAEFADLGDIPQEEIKQKTLPVFDNHRIAKRFSHRRERVIKVPDGTMLQKTSHYLQGKGITRLLMDGQIYSLSL